MRNIGFILLAGILFSFSACTTEKDFDYDVIVYGGTSAGVIAAYSAEMMGQDVLLIEDDGHVGGLTTSGLGATDVGNKYAIQGVAREFYRELGNEYDQFESWTFEPHVAEKVYHDYIEEAGVEVLYNHRIVKADTSNGKITSIEVESAKDTSEKHKDYSAKMFIDASYVGDLMARSGVSYRVGRESNAMYNETLNGVYVGDGNQFPDGISPYQEPGNPSSGLVYGIHADSMPPEGTGDDKVQAYNYRLCLTTDTNNFVPITKPEGYDPSKYELLRRVIVKRDNKGWEQNIKHLYLRIIDMPNQKTDVNNKGPMSTDFIGENWNYPEAGYEEREKIEQEHIEYMKGLLYFLGHHEDVPEHVKEQMQKYGYAKDEFADNNYWPYELYVREARRMIGQYVMTEHNCRGEETVDDGIAMGAYPMDSHNTQRIVVDGMVKNEGNVQVHVPSPYPISYRSITPKQHECRNLLVPVCLSATHIAFGSIRMEPVFMELGQAAGMASAMAIKQELDVQSVDVDELQQIKKTNPYLDGTPPDITVDNADTASVEITGDWKTIEEQRNQYVTDYLETHSPDGEQYRVTFIPEVKQSGTYGVYYYCPEKTWKDEGDWQWTQDLKVQVNHEGGTDTKKVNARANQKDWAFLGEYTFKRQGNYYTRAIADSAKHTIPADAVIWVARNDKEE